MVNLAEARRQTRRISRVPQVSDDFFPFDGGLNLLDSPMSVKPGELSGGLNYEIGIAGGYRRIAGYQIYDGSPSSANATYDLLGYGATARQSQNTNDTIDGDTSGASGQYLTHTEEGGFGVNSCLHNEAFSNAVWDIANITVIDGDETWTGGITSSLSRVTESVDVLATNHILDQDNIVTVAVGDLVFMSVFARYTSGQREGFRLGLNDTPSTSSGFSSAEVYATFSLNRGTVIDSTSSVVDSGIDLVSEGVYRCWLLTRAADAVSTMHAFIWLASETSPTTYTQNYIGDGSHLHVSGIMGVTLPFDAPHNLFHGRDYDSGTHWSLVAGTITPVDADLTWTNGVYPDFTRLTDAGSGTVTHTIRATKTGNLTPIKVKIGDKFYFEWYARYTSGQHTIQVIFADGAYNTGIFNDSLFLYIDISNGTIRPNGQAGSIDSVQIDNVDTDTWRIRATTVAAVAEGNFGMFFGHGVDSGGATALAYVSTGLYSHITGHRFESLPTGGTTTRMGYVMNTSAAKNVRSGGIILSGVSGGPFQDDEDLSFSSSVIAQAVGINVTGGESDPTLDAAYTALAVANSTPAAAPPGSGPVRGIWLYNGGRYAFRDNAGATECDMWVASGSGWTQITLNDVLNFDGTTGTEPDEGDTLTGATSSASALILRKIITSGTWGIDAVGYFVLGTVTGGPYTDNENLQVSAATVALANGVEAAPTLAPGGRYEFRNNNFYGASDLYRMYGVDGVNNGFEYDDDVTNPFFAQITTGMTNDTPNHIGVHNSFLWYSFPGGSIQNSAAGIPVNWTVILGASEIGVGDECTGFNEEVGDSLFIFTRNKTFVLSGTSRANFNLDDFNINAGSHEWSLQRIGLGCYFDDRGFTTVLQTQRSGSVNFLENTVSQKIQPLVDYLAKNTQVKCSHLVRSRNIYRCYFDNGQIISIGFRGHKVAGHTTLEYPFVANCAVSEEDSTGRERLYIGADDGNVYELETGTSFDGEVLRAYMRTVLYHSKSPSRIKKYAQARLDAQLFGTLSVKGRIEYDFDNDDFNIGDEIDFSTDEAGGYWDDFDWDNFTWDKSTSGIPQVKLEGEGVNAAVYLHSESTSDPEHVIKGLSLQWRPRRSDRRN